MDKGILFSGTIINRENLNDMENCFSKVISGKFEKVVDDVIEGLKVHGFGILTEINLKETFNIKIGVDIQRKYWILGACNPKFGYRAWENEKKAGIFLPCNVVVREIDEGETEVAIINPLITMPTFGNTELTALATEVGNALKKVVEAL